MFYIGFAVGLIIGLAAGAVVALFMVGRSIRKYDFDCYPIEPGEKYLLVSKYIGDYIGIKPLEIGGYYVLRVKVNNNENRADRC